MLTIRLDAVKIIVYGELNKQSVWIWNERETRIEL